MANSNHRLGVILAGGRATRLYPVTRVVCKQLLPVFDKPMIYYPLSTLMLAGIREFLIIGTERDIPLYRELFGDGSRWGIEINYSVQLAPNGIAEALTIAETHSPGRKTALILGDNIFFGHGMTKHLASASEATEGATVFCYHVADASRYGVLELDENGLPSKIVEKPAKPPSNWAVTGLYFYDEEAANMVGSISPSARGELEITDLNNLYMSESTLSAEYLGRGISWFDAGTHDALLQASQFVQTVQARSGDRIACPEEIAFRVDFISSDQLVQLSASPENTMISDYLSSIARSSTRN